MASNSMKIKIEFDTSSVREHLKWMRYLMTKEADKAYGKLIDLQVKAEELETSAKAVVQTRVYDAYTDPDSKSYYGLGLSARSGNLLNSISAVRDKLRDDIAGFAVFSDWTKPGQVTKWSPKGSAEAKYVDSISYAAYFLGEGEGETFIRASGMPHRDFWTPLVRTIRRLIDGSSKAAYEELLAISKPEEK